MACETVTGAGTGVGIQSVSSEQKLSTGERWSGSVLEPIAPMLMSASPNCQNNVSNYPTRPGRSPAPALSSAGEWRQDHSEDRAVVGSRVDQVAAMPAYEVLLYEPL